MYGEDFGIMTTGNLHEQYKELLNNIVTAVIDARNIDRVKCGEATWKATDRGLQVDRSYYFDAEKVRAGRDALKRKSMDPADYPSPDLAIEIDLSGPKVDRPSIYASLRVVEVWRFDGENVVIEHLQADGSYKSAEASQFLPIGAKDILRWLTDEESTNEMAWKPRLNDWARGLGRAA
jgi:Uma2 family endonuclease